MTGKKHDIILASECTETPPDDATIGVSPAQDYGQVATDYYNMPMRVITQLGSPPFPRGTNPAYRHLRAQESRYSVTSKRSLLNRIAVGLGAPTPEKMEFEGDKRKSHPDQLYPYDYVAWADLTPDAVSEVMANLRDLKLSPATRTACRALLRGIVKESWRMGAISNEVVERINSIDAPRYTKAAGGKAHSRETIQALLEVCDKGDGARDFRDGLMMALLVTTGLRRAEAVAIKLKDIDFNTHEVNVTGKGNKDRTLGIPTSTYWRLTEYLERYRGYAPGYIFNPIWRNQTEPTPSAMTQGLTVRSINQRLRRIIMMSPKLVNVDIAPHDLRRTFATHLYDKGMPIRELQIILGHSSIATTEHYLFDETKEYRSRAARLMGDDFSHPESI